MAITISNLRIMPWSQKDTLKAVFGDVMTLTFAVPHVDGESYLCGLDNERVVYPPSRPICAYTDRFVRDGDNITLQLNLTTSKLRDFVSTIRKPMPVWLQLVRVVGDKYETILLDDILALPSVIDGAMTVYEGDPLDAKLKAKMDKPLIDGTIGQVLTMGADGHYAWADLPEIPEQEQADWDESDSTAYSYIRNKPDLSIYVEKVEGKGLSTNDFTNDDKAKLTGIEAGAEVNVQADWGESDSSNDAYIKNKPDLSIYVEKEAGKGLSTNDFTNEDKAKLGGIEDGAEVNVQADWDVSDSSLDAYIKHKPALATVATTGSYNDLTDKPVQKNADWDESDSSDPAYIENKPHIPADQVQADWDESDSTEAAYIKNKPVIPQPEPQVQSDWEESDSSDVSFILNKPDLSGINAEIQGYSAAIKSRMHRQPVCATALVDGATLTIYANQNASLDYDLEYSTDQYDKQGNFIKQFPSTKEVERVLGISHNTVSFCCLGRPGHATAGGFIWRYA